MAPIGIASPVIIPCLRSKHHRYKHNIQRVETTNKQRLDRAEPIDLPELEFLEITVLVEEKAMPGFIGDAAVSYLIKTDKGSLLYDVGFGGERPALAENAKKLNIDMDQIDEVCISHLHPDHMGGLKAARKKSVEIPNALGTPQHKPCYVPDEAEAKGFNCCLVRNPRLFGCGMATTGPLARSLFFFGYTEEQAIFGNVKGKGIVIFSGCGHPTIELIVKMVRHLTVLPIYAIGGGFHFPVSEGRGNKAGIQIQTLVGTGKPPWSRITEEDLSTTIDVVNSIHPKRFLPSAHDSCDQSLARLKNEVHSDVETLRVGATYRF